MSLDNQPLNTRNSKIFKKKENTTKHTCNADKPEILKAWKTKLLVLLLCVLSFFAGWQASRSYLVKHCNAAGGLVTTQSSLIICSIP